jgi:hypothetical protein
MVFMRAGYLLLLAALMGCATERGFKRMMDDWVGEKGDRAIATWGTPINSEKLAGGGKSLQWHDGDCMVNIVTDKKDTIKSWTANGWCKR